MLSGKLPLYLAGKKTSVAVQDFADINDEATLKEVHDHLFKSYQLLDRVIRARKLHHSHFFAIDNDYGHQKYLDKLQSDRQTMLKAIGKLGKRAAVIMYEQKQWFNWVKETQEERPKPRR
jgi:CTP:phosphocholine cytidylyltransferase-like protein